MEKNEMCSKIIIEKTSNGYVFRWQSITGECPGESISSVAVGNFDADAVRQAAGCRIMDDVYCMMGGDDEVNKMIEITLNYRAI